MDKNRTKYASWLLRLLPILACIVLVLIIYHPVFFRGYWAVNKSDALQIHLPTNNFIANVFRHKRLPIWNPNFNLGQPIIDGFSLIFHPALIFYLFFSPWLANTIEIILGLVLTFLGIWYFLRQQGFEGFSASIGTLVYVLSGPVFFLHSYYLDFMAFLLLPWILWVFHQHDHTKCSKWLWTAAILCVLAVQSIEPDTLFYLYTGLIIDRFACAPQNKQRVYVITWMGILLLSGLTGLLLYLPLHEWLFYSSRITKSYGGIFHPAFLNMITAMLTNQWFIRWPYDNFYFYFGPAVVWLVLAGLVGFNKAVYAFRYFLYSLIVPSYYIIARYLQSTGLNSVDTFRSMFVFCFGLAIIASIGVRNILKGKRLQLRITLLAGLLTMALAIWAIFCGAYVFRKYIVLLIAASGMLISTFSVPKRTVIFRIIWIYIAVAATLIAPAYFFIRENRFCMIARNSSIIKRIAFYKTLGKTPDGKEAHWRIAIFGCTDNTTTLAGLRTIPNYTSVYNKKMEDSLCSDGLIRRSYGLPYWMELSNPDAYALSFYGVRFLVTVGNLLLDQNSTGWFERPDLSWYLYSVWENKYYIGRAYLVKTSGERYSGNVEFLEDTPVSVIIRAKAEEGESLVLADLDYPGWQAWVDGRNVPTEVYHGCLRSVKLSKGTHIVQWKYNGRIQRIGIILSLIALFFLAAFLIILSVLKGKTNNYR